MIVVTLSQLISSQISGGIYENQINIRMYPYIKDKFKTNKLYLCAKDIMQTKVYTINAIEKVS